MYFSRAFAWWLQWSPTFQIASDRPFPRLFGLDRRAVRLATTDTPNIAPSFRLHSYQTDIYRLLACATISLRYLLVHPEQIGNKVIIQNHTGRSPAASVPAAMWELNRNGKAISPSIACALLPHIEMLNQKHALLLFLCKEREKKNAGKASWKIDCRSGSRFQSYRSESERKGESSLGWDGFYIILCHQTTQHLILSSAYQTNPFPSCCSFPFFLLDGRVHMLA